MNVIPERRVDTAEVEKTESQTRALILLREAFDHAGEGIFAGHIGRGVAHGRLSQNTGNGDKQPLLRGRHGFAGLPGEEECGARVHIHDMGELRVRCIRRRLDEANARAVHNHIQ